MAYVYKITNLVNGKIYIGKTYKTADESLRWFESMPSSPLYEEVVKWLKTAVRNK